MPSRAGSSLQACPFPQNKFRMDVKALEFAGGQHVCSLPEKDRSGVIHVKPTSLSHSLTVKASVVCDVCPCEQVGDAESCPSPPGQPWGGNGFFWCSWVFLGLAKISITACPKLGVMSCGRAWSSGQNFAPGSALLIPERVLGGS